MTVDTLVFTLFPVFAGIVSLLYIPPSRKFFRLMHVWWDGHNVQERFNVGEGMVLLLLLLFVLILLLRT